MAEMRLKCPILRFYRETLRGGVCGKKCLLGGFQGEIRPILIHPATPFRPRPGRAPARGRPLRIPHPSAKKSRFSQPPPHRQGPILAFSGHPVGCPEGLRRQHAKVQQRRGFPRFEKFT